MKTNKTDISKISLSEMLNDSNGKSSITAAVGGYLCFTGSIMFILAAIAIILFGKTNADSVMIQSLALVGSGSTLILAKRLKPTKDTTNLNEESPDSNTNIL